MFFIVLLFLKCTTKCRFWCWCSINRLDRKEKLIDFDNFNVKILKMLLLQNPSTDSGFSAGNWSNVLSKSVSRKENSNQINCIFCNGQTEAKPRWNRIVKSLLAQSLTLDTGCCSKCTKKIYHTVNRLRSFLSSYNPVIHSVSLLVITLLVTRSLSHSVTQSLGHSVTWSLSHLVTLYFQCCDKRTNT